MAKLRLDNVEKIYFGGYVGIKGANFTLESNGVLAVFGKKGAGKSTLLKLIAGLERPSSGEITLNGESLFDILPEKRNISMISSELGLFRRKSVFYNLAYPLIIRKVEKCEIGRKVNEIAKLFYLDNILDEKVRFVSKAQYARILIARGFVRDSDIYLFDNPLKSFTLDDRDDVMTAMNTAISHIGGSIIYATDRLDEVSQIAGQNTAILSNGMMLEVGDISDIYRNAEHLESVRLLSDGSNNEITAEVKKDGGGYYVDVLGKHYIDINDIYLGKEVIVNALSEDLRISGDGDKYTVRRVIRRVDSDYVVLEREGITLVMRSEPKKLNELDGVNVIASTVNVYDKTAERMISLQKRNKGDNFHE